MQAPSRSAVIAAELRDEILRGQYRAGERLPSERDLADRFGAHRSAVREALKSLEQLGLADIRRGGVRVLPIEQASLDVVEHLLDLEHPPDSGIVSDVVEVVGGLFSVAARLCAERANDAQRQDIHELLMEIEGSELPTTERLQQIHRLGDLFVEASGNMVLGLVRKGVNTRFVESMEARRPQTDELLEIDSKVIRGVDEAIARGDGSAAADAINGLAHLLRRHVLETMEAERKRLRQLEEEAS
jgi:GntR family transcriptional repressor for pyruvate dehydrogenase complex